MSKFVLAQFIVPEMRSPISMRYLVPARREYRNISRREAEQYLAIHNNVDSIHYLPYIIRPCKYGEPYYALTKWNGEKFVHHIFSVKNGYYTLHTKGKVQVFHCERNLIASLN